MIAEEIAGLFSRVSDGIPEGLGGLDALWRKIPGPEDGAHLLDDAAGTRHVIGVIDHAIPFAHPRLTDAVGNARTAAIWMMDGLDPDDVALASGGDLPFGTELRGPAITTLRARHRSAWGVDEDALYRAAGAVSAARTRRMSLARSATHGAAIADIAAGAAPDSPAAEGRPLIAVGLPDDVVRDTSGTLAPWFVLLGTLFVLRRAQMLSRTIGRPLPVTVNLSFGVTAGARDGSGHVDRFQDAVTLGAEGMGLGPVRFVVPMGNHLQSRTGGILEPGQSVGWRIPPQDATPSYLDIRLPHPQPDRARLILTPPGGAPQATPLPAPGQSRDLMDGDRHLGRLYAARVRGAVGHVLVLTLAVPPTDGRGAPEIAGRPGLWDVMLEATDQPAEIAVQRDDSGRALPSFGRQSKLIHHSYVRTDPIGHPLRDGDVGPVRRGRTVNAFACGHEQVRVGATDAGGAMAPYSGRDAARAAADGDELAPGDRSRNRAGLVTAGPRAGGHQRIRGTSIAAAGVTARLSDGAP